MKDSEDGSNLICGWNSVFPIFRDTPLSTILSNLSSFVSDPSSQQVDAWRDSVPKIQGEVGEYLVAESKANQYSAILEYELPMESRRPDVILLVDGAVVVLECKHKASLSQADLDQAAAYARDLRCYHRECAEVPVHAVVIPTLARGKSSQENGVVISPPEQIDGILGTLERHHSARIIPSNDFLSPTAYRPLPTIVQAARELIRSGTIRPIHRARAATDPAINEIARIIHQAAQTKTRRLILLTGVPGAGKTLVGLQTVHAHYLDDLAIPRPDGKPTAPAVFLSGNGPLVEVLQYELRSAGGGGRTFVRGVKDYVKAYSRNEKLVPPEHVLVFDEAQRAFDAEQVREKHTNTPGYGGGKSEPEHFIEFAERIPEWCVVIGLIGSGQEIHVGEEAGLVQWRHAAERSKYPDQWFIHTPQREANTFQGSSVKVEISSALSLDIEIRFHMASHLHRYVADLLAAKSPTDNHALANSLEREGYHLRITRNLDTAKQYLWERYAENPDARYGLIASSKDKDLVRFGVDNDFQSTKRIRFGPWYGDQKNDAGGYSCTNLDTVVTEFGAQGLELDASLVAWGTDLMMTHGKWSNSRARGYLRSAHVRDPFQLRINAYRVLLTRGRDGSVVFVPNLKELDETYTYHRTSGFKAL